jgi:hypothetical protein
MQAARPDVSTWFTLPVLPQGLTQDGLNVVERALQAGVRLDGVNVMAMNYGDSVAPPELKTMGAYAIDAAESTYAQLTELFASYGQSFDWNQLGVTPMIGVNDITTEIFTPDDAQLLEDFAREKDLGMLSMWSIARDKSGPIGQVSPVHSGSAEAEGRYSRIWEDYGMDPVIGDGTPSTPNNPVTNPDSVDGTAKLLVEIDGNTSMLTAQDRVAERFQPSYSWGRELVIDGFDASEDVLDLTKFWNEGGGGRTSPAIGWCHRRAPLQSTASLPSRTEGRGPDSWFH